jgi:hypothetical protein
VRRCGAAPGEVGRGFHAQIVGRTASAVPMIRIRGDKYHRIRWFERRYHMLARRRYVMPIATAAATAIAIAPPITATGIQRGIGSDGTSPISGTSAACAAGPIA